MVFTETKLKGAFIIDLERREDSRGFFARVFCQHEFQDHGLKPIIAQANVAFNHKKGTMRGMHFQFPPVAETKLVRSTRGAILDIIVDLRPESPTYLQHVAYAPGSECGLLYSDPRLKLEWPLPVAVISEKDERWKTLEEQESEIVRKMSLTIPAVV